MQYIIIFMRKFRAFSAARVQGVLNELNRLISNVFDCICSTCTLVPIF